MFQLKSLRGLRWTAGLLSLAVTVSGLGVAAAASDEPKQEEKKAEQKKESPKKDKIKKELPDKNTPNFEDVFKNVPQGVDPEQMRQFQREMQRMMEQMRQQFQPGGFPQGGFQGGAGFQGGPYAAFMRNREGRLGARVATPSATLIEQLDLPKGQGLVIEDVQPESAAAKGGIKNHDILLEFNGKPVHSNPAEFVRTLQETKADTKVDAIVLRKGKRETIKGLSLPEAKAEAEPPLPFKGFPGAQGAPGGFQPGVGGPAAGFGGFGPPGGLPGAAGAPGGHHVMTTVFRTDNRFTTRHQEGSLIITATGTVADGKAQVSAIQVQDGRESHKYESLDKVPEQYRDKVKNLIDMTQGSTGKVDIKTPKIQEQKD